MLSKQIIEGVLYLIYYFAIYLWYIYLILGSVFLLIARRWFLAATSMGGKIGSGILIFIGGIILILGIYGAYIQLNDRSKSKTDTLHIWYLDEETEVDGMLLPQGTKIRLRESFDMNLKEQAVYYDIWWIILSEPTKLFGMMFSDGWNLYLDEVRIKGYLLGTQYVKGIPVSEHIWITKDGAVIKAHAAYDIEVNGQSIDKGMVIYFGAENDSQKEYLRVEHPRQAFDSYRIELNYKAENTVIKR